MTNLSFYIFSYLFLVNPCYRINNLVFFYYIYLFPTLLLRLVINWKLLLHLLLHSLNPHLNQTRRDFLSIFFWLALAWNLKFRLITFLQLITDLVTKPKIITCIEKIRVSALHFLLLLRFHSIGPHCFDLNRSRDLDHWWLYFYFWLDICLRYLLLGFNLQFFRFFKNDCTFDFAGFLAQQYINFPLTFLCL